MAPFSKLKAFFRRSLHMSDKNSNSNVDAPHPSTTPATTIPLVKNTTRRGPLNGPAAYARAVSRYNFDTPVFVAHRHIVYKRDLVHRDAHKSKHHGRRVPPDAKSGPPSGTTEVPANDVQSDIEYVVPVTIGTPGVTFNLDFDTGSSDLWVWSSELRVNTAGHDIYNPAASSTAQQVEGATWSISYGDGSTASGNVFKDTVKIGDLTIPGQAIELAQKLSSAFMQGGSDGLLGLAWPNINTVQPKPVATPVQNISQQGIAPGVFSVALDKGDNNGFYTFGGIDVDKAGVTLNDITYTAVDNSEGFWMFNSQTVVVNGQAISQSGNQAILDTGTTLCLLSDATTNAIYKHVRGAKLDQQQGGWVYPSDAQIPTIAIAVGNQQYTLNPADFGFGDAGNGMTFGGIQSRGNNPFDILGDVFLKSIYAIFDQDNQRIGVAQRQGNVAA